MSCEHGRACYSCPVNWDCEVTLEDQCDYEHNEGYAEMSEGWDDLPDWNNGLFWKD